MNIFDRLARGTIVCDRCGRRFKQNLEDVATPDGGAIRQFLCTRCGAVYEVARISPRGVQIAEELQNVELRSPDARKTIARLRKQLKAEVTRP